MRTLHHYDAIGLLCPRGRGATGYRRYGECDLERLQQILFYRELGFALDDIATIMDDPGIDATAHLRRQRTLLTQRYGVGAPRPVGGLGAAPPPRLVRQPHFVTFIEQRPPPEQRR